jgi:hypothetical protein
MNDMGKQKVPRVFLRPSKSRPQGEEKNSQYYVRENYSRWDDASKVLAERSGEYRYYYPGRSVQFSNFSSVQFVMEISETAA